MHNFSFSVLRTEVPYPYSVVELLQHVLRHFNWELSWNGWFNLLLFPSFFLFSWHEKWLLSLSLPTLYLFEKSAQDILEAIRVTEFFPHIYCLFYGQQKWIDKRYYFHTASTSFKSQILLQCSYLNHILRLKSICAKGYFEITLLT